MKTPFSIAYQIVLDVLATRPPRGDAVFTMRTVDQRVLSGERQARANLYASMVPADATEADACRIAASIVRVMGNA